MTDCVFIGESWGKDEALYEFPFVGAAGQELSRMLAKAGFPVDAPGYRYCSPMTMMSKWANFPYPLLNVFNERPAKDSNNVSLLYAKPRDGQEVDRSYPVRRLGNANYFVLASKSHHLKALHTKLKELKPNLIVCLGATACWALGLGSSIGKLRGFVHQTEFGKVLPVYHPSAILQNWSLRAVTLMDFAKAQRELQFPGFRLMEREIWTEPTIEDLYLWWETYGKQASLLAVDIETLRRSQVSEIGFASDPQHALHIPFVWQDYSKPKPYQQWWSSAKEEVQAWQFVKMVCESDIPKIGQNLQYDVYWLAKEMGIAVHNWQHDTLIAAHAWQPELPKGLNELGALFLDELSWKSIRKDSNKEKDND